MEYAWAASYLNMKRIQEQHKHGYICEVAQPTTCCRSRDSSSSSSRRSQRASSHLAMDRLSSRTVLIAVDHTDHSLYALKWALDVLLVGRLANCRIVVLCAHTPLSCPASVQTTDVDTYEEYAISRINTLVNQICAQRNIDAEIKVLIGDPRRVITETVGMLEADFLVMGSHVSGPIQRVLLESMNDYCAHHVKCTLVIVRKPSEPL